MTVIGVLGAFVACIVGYAVGYFDAKTHFTNMIKKHIEFIEQAIKSKGGNSK